VDERWPDLDGEKTGNGILYPARNKSPSLDRVDSRVS
jgi:hypothetical protein